MGTIIDLFESSTTNFKDNPFLLEKQKGSYKPLSYKDTREKVLHLASGLLEVGVQKGDRLALLSEGRNYWVISELGILYTGAINVPLSIKLNPEELKFRLNHSETTILIISKAQVWKVREIKEDLHHLKHIILLDEDVYEEKERYIGDLLKTGAEKLGAFSPQLEQIRQNIQGDDYANIMYTSGTTSDPKGVILSHRNYTANVAQSLSLMEIDENYRTLTILPLDHCFAHVGNMYAFMARGASMAMVESGKTPMETLKNIPTNIKEVKPHMILSVPALAKNFKKNIEKGIKEKGPKVEKIFNHALKLAYSYNKEGYNKGGLHQLWKKPILKVYDQILFKKIRQGFGGDLKFFIGGGAYLDIGIQRFFYAIGMPMFQGYGLSEATPVISSNSLQKHKLGSSGHLAKHLDVRVVDGSGNSLSPGKTGEITVKGENVMKGYWKNEEATNKTVKDGWLHTGDLGYMDEDGFLYISGRFKSLLISNDGEKYSPEGIEEMIMSRSPYIDQIMLHNNQDIYTVGLVVPDIEALKAYLDANQINPDSENAISSVLKLLESEIQQYYTGGIYESLFPDRWLPTAIAVLDEPFSQQNGFINSTLKIVRPKITEFYKDRIQDLHTVEGKKINDPQNITAIKKWLMSH